MVWRLGAKPRVALITPAPSAFADVIADWNEKAVAFVTPRMTPPAAQRVVAIARLGDGSFWSDARSIEVREAACTEPG